MRGKPGDLKVGGGRPALGWGWTPSRSVEQSGGAKVCLWGAESSKTSVGESITGKRQKNSLSQDWIVYPEHDLRPIVERLRPDPCLTVVLLQQTEPSPF